MESCHDHPARSIAVLCEDLAALSVGTGDWAAPDALIAEVIKQLDQKRYDLPPGVLSRAAQALERAGANPGSLRLEARDMNTR